MFLDISATLEDRATLVDLVGRVAERLAIPFTVGGGIRSVSDAEALLRAGADKVSVNSAALERPELVTELAEKLGSQAVVVAIDATEGDVRSRAGTARTPRRAAEWARECERARRRRDPAHVDRRRRHARGLRPRAHGGGRGRRLRSRHRVGRRGRGDPRRRGAADRAGGAARVDPARGPVAARPPARRAPRHGRPASRCSRLRAAIVQDADDGPRADARVDERRGRAADARDRRGVVLEPLARAALEEGRDVGQHARRRGATRRLRRRRAARPRAAERPGVPHELASPASRRGSGGLSPSARRSGPKARTSRRCSTKASPRARARSGRRPSKRRSPRSRSPTSACVEEVADLWFHSYVLLARAGSIPRGRGRAQPSPL